jgi:hypothetical protein
MQAAHENLIEVDVYDGHVIPMDDCSYDVVILADVLHHTTHPDKLVAEGIRVSRRLLVIKDHQRKGVLAQARISFLDWAQIFPMGYSVSTGTIPMSGQISFGVIGFMSERSLTRSLFIRPGTISSSAALSITW